MFPAGTRNLDCLDVFSVSKRVTQAFVRQGRRAVAYDIKTGGRNQDILTWEPQKNAHVSMSYVRPKGEPGERRIYLRVRLWQCRTDLSYELTKTFHLFLDAVLRHDGFWNLCSMGMAIVDNGLCMLAPPCSMFIYLSVSVHRRDSCGPAPWSQLFYGTGTEFPPFIP